ncbi:hypothetical protein ANCDUO_05958 [Ancylostoma duodenale]|uniref:Uncharacterized protein n=1 Tax=Ancylostoma duodenale TaxID=51022 RepID=A0A0C2GXD7_9BILA|nr:hypothetical protein ANCDUO_05958 [Ancylostoma duodenale]
MNSSLLHFVRKIISSSTEVNMLNSSTSVEDALSRFDSVLWLNHDLEFLSKNLDEVLNKSTSSVTTIGREYAAWERKNAFIPYFPGTRASTENYTMLLLREGAQPTLHW